MHEIRIRRSTAVALAVFFSSGTALVATEVQADQHTAQLNVSAFVDDSCGVAVLSHLDFGDYDPINGNEASASFRVTCQIEQDVEVRIDGGAFQASDASMRRISNGTDFIPYSIKTNGIEWNPSSLLPTWEGFSVSSFLDLNVDGELLANGIVSGGSYNDSLTITIAPVL